MSTNAKTSAEALNRIGSGTRPEPGTGLRLVIAGGSTGGHLFPGIAIAEEFMRRNPQNHILFASTGRPFELEILAAKGFEHRALRAEGLKGRGVLNQARALLKVPAGMYDAVRILSWFRPHLVLGMGGYSAGPVVLAAWIRGIKIVLHEQNQLPGITTRLSAPLAHRIYLSYADSGRTFDPAKVRLTGNPVRSEIIALGACGKDTDLEPSDAGRPFTVLIVGGSQGAHRINLTVLDCLTKLGRPRDFYFIHQTGSADEDVVLRAYRRAEAAAEVRAFFNDMDHQYRRADLIICRAGATTVAELTVIGKPVIFIPFPFAADNHQVLNAEPLVAAGAAEMILEQNLTGEGLAERIEYYASRPEELAHMAARCKSLGRPDAAATLVDDCYELLAASRL
jgi:UDP-N-acetylglucosamine--N-acetylmuramyl-(pentapeptide) pyrophosphoryl-undecaprenol N-acetylglucosamine transferase